MAGDNPANDCRQPRRSLRLLPELHGPEPTVASDPAQTSELLSSSIRPRRTLYAGDTIQYFPLAFEVGNRQGLRQAVVARIDTNDPEGHPVRINGHELLTPDTYLTVVPDGAGVAVQETWSMRKWWILVPGRVSVRSRQSVFTERLRSAVVQSFSTLQQRKTTREHEGNDVKHNDTPVSGGEAGQYLEHCSEPDRGASAENSGDDMETAVAAEPSCSPRRDQTCVVEATDPKPVPGVPPVQTQPTDIDEFEKLLTLSQRRAKHHRAKDKLGARSVSRKRRHKKMRVPNRDSQNVYHASAPDATRLQCVVRLPDVKQALLEHREERARALRKAAAATDAAQKAPVVVEEVRASAPEVLGSPSCAEPILERVVLPPPPPAQIQARQVVAWPGGVVRITSQRNPNAIRFKPVDDFGVCECYDNGDCYRFKCENANMGYYCTASNCAFGGGCGNSPRELPSLQLFLTDACGYGVFTAGPINADVVVAGYCGVIEAIEGTTGSVPIKHNSGYSLIHPVRDASGKFVYIEPYTYGSIARFMNHSCEPSCVFQPAQNGDEATILVVSTRFIRTNEEITVKYSGTLWFDCECGAPTCVRSGAPTAK